MYDNCEIGNLKGFYKVIKRNRCIFLNKNLSEREATLVCGHETGHDQAHRKDLETITLDDREILNYIKYYEYDAEQIARAMNSDINLIALKISHLIEMGYNLRGIECNSRFLR